MTILNISFMTERAIEARLLNWLRREAPVLFSVAPDYRVVEVAEVEGDPGYSSQALNLALQFDFSTLADAHDCAMIVMPVVREKLSEVFGEQVMVFATILETRPAI